MQEPDARGRLTVNLRGLEAPALCSLHGYFGEILAWPGRVEGRIRNCSIRIDHGADLHADLALNCSTRTGENVGHDPLGDFTLYNAFGDWCRRGSGRLRWRRGGLRCRLL